MAPTLVYQSHTTHIYNWPSFGPQSTGSTGYTYASRADLKNVHPPIIHHHISCPCICSLFTIHIQGCQDNYSSIAFFTHFPISCCPGLAQNDLIKKSFQLSIDQNDETLKYRYKFGGDGMRYEIWIQDSHLGLVASTTELTEKVQMCFNQSKMITLNVEKICQAQIYTHKAAQWSQEKF